MFCVHLGPRYLQPIHSLLRPAPWPGADPGIGHPFAHGFLPTFSQWQILEDNWKAEDYRESGYFSLPALAVAPTGHSLPICLFLKSLRNPFPNLGFLSI